MRAEWRSWTWYLALASTWVLAVASTGAAAPSGRPCPRTVAHYRDGRLAKWLCESDARRSGLTVIDLGDDWVPLGLRDDGAVAGPAYRETYLALSRQDPEAVADPRSRALSFYGIFPTLSLVLSRMTDEQRIKCHAAIEQGTMPPVRRLVEESMAVGRQRVRTHVRQRASLEVQMRKRGMASLEELAALGAYYQRQIATLNRREQRTRSIRLVQRHLACEADAADVLVDGVLGWRTTHALRIYQRRSFLPPTGWIEPTTFASLQAGTMDNEWRSALRVLRERVVDATGLIEDGSASNQTTPIVGQRLDPVGLVWPKGYPASPRGAPDLIGSATDRAARHLGWDDPEALLHFAQRHTDPRGAPLALRVAVALPPLPAYHSAHMELRIELDLGTQFTPRKARWPRAGRRPALLVFTKSGEGERLLARWPTTIGGWQDERLKGGAVVERFKPSETGEFVWKTLYMAPRWLAPESTPHTDVIKRNDRGKWELDRELLGPSFRSAYGLAMLILHRPYRHREETRYADQGIRVHGTGNILSLDRGTSHGCHRLLGFQAMRLAAFLLQHRTHERVGPEPVIFSRVFRNKGLAFPVTLRQRGYRFNFTPPVPVTVGLRSRVANP